MENWGGKAPEVALKLRVESGEWRIGVEKLRFSSIVMWCLPFVGFLRCDIHNLAFGSCGTSNLHRCFASCVSLQSTIEKVRISSFTLSGKHDFRRISFERVLVRQSLSQLR